VLTPADPTDSTELACDVLISAALTYYLAMARDGMIKFVADLRDET
jgi:hypothetical protein